jgi:hypothetical protein
MRDLDRSTCRDTILNALDEAWNRLASWIHKTDIISVTDPDIKQRLGVGVDDAAPNEHPTLRSLK